MIERTNFYCQQKCGAVDFCIDEWNKAFKFCIENNLSEKQMASILEGEPCEKQCDACINIVLDTQANNKKIREKQYYKETYQ